MSKNRWSTLRNGALIAGCAACVCAACSDEQAPAPRTAVTAPKADEHVAASSAGAPVKVSESVQKKCQIPDTPRESPQFDFDEAELRARGERILDGVAQCMQRGALQGEKVTLIGHADPRGPDWYNQRLGLARAAAAREYLASRGVSVASLALESRGERGASGTGPASWQLDRRVDIEQGTP